MITTVGTQQVYARDVRVGQVLLIRDGLDRVRAVSVWRIDAMRDGGLMLWCTDRFHFQASGDAVFTAIDNPVAAVVEAAGSSLRTRPDRADSDCSARCKRSARSRCRCGCAGLQHGTTRDEKS